MHVPRKFLLDEFGDSNIPDLPVTHEDFHRGMGPFGFD